jgi:ATP-dependent helicase/nuclease subunit A
MNAAPTRAAKEALATDAQRAAADPAASVWVTASAGTGKTKVLTDRLLALLLAGTEPGKILCLTFTKAAAAEMANRLADRLATWASAPEADLSKDLALLLGRSASEAEAARARSLFARVLDTPGGMKIQTIHAFCQSLLGRFPVEAEIAPHFQVLDERTAAEMLEAARAEVLAGSQGPEGAETAADIAAITAHAHEQTFAELMEELIRERGRLLRATREPAGFEALVARLYRLLGADPGTPAEALIAAACRDEALDLMGLGLIAEALAKGSVKEDEKAAVVRDWLAAEEDGRIAGLDGYMAVFLTAEGAPRKQLLTKGAAAAVPGAGEIMEAEAARLVRLRAEVGAARVAAASAALLRLGARIVAAYERHKRARGLLDYDDLILGARDLLADTGGSAWVLYKLDGGIDHVLVDEAQDTNPEQWEVIQAISEEFFAGEGAREGPRTVFAVGDEKQSIYGFQRADPEKFSQMRAVFGQRAWRARQEWAALDLAVSFRSTAAVLEAVDAVFARPEARGGVISGEGELHHEPVRVGEAGRVELWPPADPEESELPEPWAPPLAAESRPPPRARLAEEIASRIWRWTRDPESDDDPEAQLPARGRRMRPGDVMVLVRRRNEFVEELVRALKQRQVPVAGVDRMVLSEQLAVMDLVALGRVLLLPDDDLTLATVLKGPLFGFTEDELFRLAHGREGGLWSALAARAGEGEPYRSAHTELTNLRARADYLRPFELFAEVLGPHGGRRRLVGRLGFDAGDPIDEFLSLALSYEREAIPSLEGFLHWLEAGRSEIKRDLEHGGGAVRVMTVHGAKGLQAPVVFLPDTLQVPLRGPGVYWISPEGGEAARDLGPVALWPIRKDYDGEAAAAARAAAAEAREREYRRLLYVAMTRAEDRLYVCGWNTRKAAPEGCWYNLVEQALGGMDDVEETALDFGGGWAGPGWRLDCAQEAAAEPEAPSVVPPAAELPGWAGRAAPAEPAPPRPLAPSRPAAEEPAVRSPLGPDAGLRFRRGRLVHRLLEVLPNLPVERRSEAARRFLARPVHRLSDEQQGEILEETLAVLDHPDLAPLFAVGSRAEVPLVGMIEGAGGPEVVSGQVDRLAVTDEAVLVVDYKTHRPPPAEEAGVPPVYLSQMAAYRALLADIFPDKRVDCCLLWTEAPRLMQISPALLASHAP